MEMMCASAMAFAIHGSKSHDGIVNHMALRQVESQSVMANTMKMSRAEMINP